MELLILGCSGAGKTLLVQRIKNVCNEGVSDSKELPKLSRTTSSTVGVELDRVQYKKSKLVLREVGGPMMSTWPAYLKNCALLMVVFRDNRMVELHVDCFLFVLVRDRSIKSRAGCSSCC